MNNNSFLTENMGSELNSLENFSIMNMGFEIQKETQSDIFRFNTKNDSLSSSWVMDGKDGVNFKGMVLDSQTTNFLDANKETSVIFNQIIREIDKHLIEKERNYLIHPSVDFLETKYNKLVIKIYVTKKDFGEIISLWNKLVETMIDKISEVENLTERARLKTFFSLEVIDLENGYKL